MIGRALLSNDSMDLAMSCLGTLPDKSTSAMVQSIASDGFNFHVGSIIVQSGSATMILSRIALRESQQETRHSRTLDHEA